jgi:hypothetical protein
MVKRIVLVGGLAVAAALVLGTAACSGGKYASTPPPEPQMETPPPQPAGAVVWIPGHHAWKHGQYVWMQGHWERERPGKAWVPGHWKQRGHRWVWVGGHWK